MLLSTQLGVSIPQATEIIAHAIQAWYQHPKPDEVLLLVDFENAYNSLDRQAMIDAVCGDAPEFARYAAFCYGSPVPLIGDGFHLISAEGTQQGDVCGPLFFSLTLNRVLMECGQDEPDRWSRAYLDDVNTCGKEQKVLGYFQRIKAKSPSIGLKINLNKCQLWGPSVEDPHPSGIPVANGRRASRSLVLLWYQSSSCRRMSTASLRSWAACLERLSQLADTHARFHILQKSLHDYKVNHVLPHAPFRSGHQLKR